MNGTDNITYTYIADMAQADTDIADTDMADIANKEEKSWTVFTQYLHTHNEYLFNFSQSTKYNKMAPDNIYLLVNGLNTLTHVFKIILEQTSQSRLALGNMQKCIYYYRPFIEQMEENILHDLNISSNSASIFVYKKTIGMIEVSQMNNTGEAKSDLIHSIEKLILIHRQIFDLLINSSKNMNEVVEKLTEALKGLCADPDSTSEKAFQHHLDNILVFIKHIISDNELDINAKYELIHLYINDKEPHTLSIASLCKKKAHPEYYERLGRRNMRWLRGMLPQTPYYVKN
jgi:hypothetical protein